MSFDDLHHAQMDLLIRPSEAAKKNRINYEFNVEKTEHRVIQHILIQLLLLLLHALVPEVCFVSLLFKVLRFKVYLSSSGGTELQAQSKNTTMI